MPDIAGASVWLEIDGVRLEEFGVERDEGKKTVTCWVPCKTGKVRAYNFGSSFLAELFLGVSLWCEPRGGCAA